MLAIAVMPFCWVVEYGCGGSSPLAVERTFVA
jgi:hypothetical protein